MRCCGLLCLPVLIGGPWFAVAGEIDAPAAVHDVYDASGLSYAAAPMQRRYGAIEHAELDPTSRFVVTTPTPWSSPPAAYAGLGYWGYGARFGFPGFGYRMPYRNGYGYGYYPDYWRFAPYPRYRPFPFGDADRPYYGLHREWLDASLRPPLMLPPYSEESAPTGPFYW